MQMRATSALVLVLALLTSCVSTSRPRPVPDVQAALNAALTWLETPRGPSAQVASRAPLVLVLTPNLSKPLREAALALHRPTVEESELPDRTHFVIPAGYLRLDSLTIQGDSALFLGLAGPVPAPDPVPLIIQPRVGGCGSGYEIQLNRNSSGIWVPTRTGIHLCHIQSSEEHLAT